MITAALRTTALLRSDRGSTLPIAIWLTGILLFAAFAFFAFAQAASARNGAQSAADAAALAAAQSARDDLVEGLGDAVGGDADWLDWLDPENLEGGEAAAAADALAAENDSAVTGFAGATVGGYLGYAVDIQTNYTVGDSIIPGTETQHANAHATAVIEPRCDFPVDADPAELVTLDCDGEVVNIDPEDFDLDDLPDASVLFSVQLAE
ncbi:pilus assembly protein TadG-related protein [Streptomyces phaeochromogenes]|uniref:pilus assembly protein TadG-related protein n=1 Tax=Streptomyces phaeochromogenes TaxID=1923 RepID=UPI002258E2CC|nr:pilus assembly protein TadG-related protein [Streptomyces phaeochromogenes]MCX5601863.1 pilus assembly protein TadG-related protein [Streptomyces phaeochromogenes]